MTFFLFLHEGDETFQVGRGRDGAWQLRLVFRPEGLAADEVGRAIAHFADRHPAGSVSFQVEADHRVCSTESRPPLPPLLLSGDRR